MARPRLVDADFLGLVVVTCVAVYLIGSWFISGVEQGVIDDINWRKKESNLQIDRDSTEALRKILEERDKAMLATVR